MKSEFGRVIDALPGLVWTSLQDGHADFLNQRWLEYTGLTKAEAIGQGWQAAVHPEDTSRVFGCWQGQVAAGEPGEVEARLRRFDGAYRWFHFRFTPVKDANGHIVKWCGINTDIEDLKRAEEAAQRHEWRFRSIIEGLPAIVTLMTPEGAFAHGNQRMVDYLGAPLDVLKARQTTQSFHPDDRPEVDRRWKRSIETGEPYDYEARLKGGDGVYRWFHSRGLPLRDPDGRIALWYLLQENVDDRRRAADALRASEQSARAIVDGIPGLVAVFSPDGVLEHVNQQVVAFWGKSQEELKNWAWADVLHPEDAPRALSAFSEAVVSKSPFELEVRARRFDGVYRWLQSRMFPVKDADGRVVRWYNLLIDIDEKKRAENALAASERKLKLAIDATPAMLWSADDDGVMDAVNQTYVDFVGAPFDELDRAGWPVKSVHPEDRRRLFGKWKQMTELGVAGNEEARLRRHDGEYRWFQFRGNPLRDETGKIVKWYCVNFDIEDRKRAEGALQVSERNLKLSIDATPAMIWTTDARGETQSVNQNYLDYVGLSLEQLLGWGWTIVIHPDDQARLTSEWQSILASEAPGTAEARLRRHDGEYRWFLLRANPRRDENGNVVNWYGVNTDIEDRKRAEQAVAVSESNLKLIIDTTPALIWTARPDGMTESVNKYVVDYAGLSSAQLEGVGRAAMVHPDDQKTLAAEWRKLLASGTAGQSEVRLRRHDGEYRWFLSRANPLRDDKGNIVKWYGVHTDIDDRKRAEVELQRALGHLTEAQRLSRTGSFTADLQRDEHVWSEELYRIFEFEPASAIKLQKVQEVIHPEDMPLYEAEIQRGIAGSDIDFVFRITTVSGAVKHLHAVSHRIGEIVDRPVFFGAIQDITESRIAEGALRRSEAFLAHGEAVSQTGSFLWRMESGEIRWSSQLYRIFDFDPGTPVTLERITGRVHPEDIWMMEEMVRRAQDGRGLRYEHRLLMPDGSVKHLQLVARATLDQDGRLEYIGTVQDVTERRLAEQALSKVRSELAHVARLTSLNALTASIAHEVNQPLSGIITNASTCLRMLAVDPPNLDGARETARRTIRDGDRASAVITRLRALFSKKEPTVESVNLNEAARDVIALSSNDLQRNRVVLRVDLSDDIPPVTGDRVQLQQVILNLILNASDAMSGINERARQLVIKTEREEGGRVRLTVQDSGTGFGPRGAEKIFDAFYTTKPGGMGIGLSVSRSIIESHRGRLWAAPNDGPGATFSFSIPCSLEERPELGIFRIAGTTDEIKHWRHP